MPSDDKIGVDEELGSVKGGRAQPDEKAVVAEARRLRSEKKVDDAIALLTTGMERGFISSEPLLLLAELRMEKNELAGALEMLDELVRREPDSKQHLMKRSVVRFKMDDRAGALEDIKKAGEIDPDDPNVIKGLVDVNASLGLYDEAMGAIRRLNGSNQVDASINERKKNLLNLIRLRAESDECRVLLDAARESMRKESLLVARTLLSKIVEGKNADYYETACVMYRKLGMPHKVVELADEAVKRDLANGKVLRALAFVHMEQGRFAEATRLFDRIIESDDDPSVKADRALAKMSAGDLKGALEDIDSAISANPARDLFYIRKGDIAARMEGLEAALKCYELAIKANPLNIEAHERRQAAGTILSKGAGESDRSLFR